MTKNAPQEKLRGILEHLAREFWQWRARNQPFSPDDIARIERPLGLVPDWSAEAIERRRTELATFEKQWHAIDIGSWKVPERVDYRLLGSALARVHWELDVLRRWQRDPTFYLEQTITAVQEALTIPAPYDSSTSAEILSRIENIPLTLEFAFQNLRDPPAPLAMHAYRSLDRIRERMQAMADALQPHTTLSGAQLLTAILVLLRMTKESTASAVSKS